MFSGEIFSGGERLCGEWCGLPDWINGVRSIYRIAAWADQNIEAGEWAGLIVLTEMIQTDIDLIA